MSDSNTALVAEDNVALCQVIALTLRKAGFSVTATLDGVEALKEAQQGDFDLVVSDLQMPRMSGLELIEKLRDEPSYADTPIILLTAKGLELRFEQLETEYGVAALLIKPFSPTELAGKARSLVAQSV